MLRKSPIYNDCLLMRQDNKDPVQVTFLSSTAYMNGTKTTPSIVKFNLTRTGWHLLAKTVKTCFN